MGTIINKIIFGLVFAFLSWKGLDGLLVNYYSNSIYDIGIQAYEDQGNRSKRHLKIRNAIGLSNFIYFEESTYSSSVDVVYPAISHNLKTMLDNDTLIYVSVLVRRNNIPRNNMYDLSFLLPDSTELIGLSTSGFEYLSEQEKALLETEKLKIAEHAALIELGATPIALHWNLLMFIGGTLFAFVIWKSFFRKASSLEDYWNKITEKESR